MNIEGKMFDTIFWKISLEGLKRYA